MLILTRQVDDSIIIKTPQGNVEVKVLAVHQNWENKPLKSPHVQLGIQAPESFNIVRKELL